MSDLDGDRVSVEVVDERFIDFERFGKHASFGDESAIRMLDSVL